MVDMAIQTMVMGIQTTVMGIQTMVMGVQIMVMAIQIMVMVIRIMDGILGIIFHVQLTHRRIGFLVAILDPYGKALAVVPSVDAKSIIVQDVAQT